MNKLLPRYLIILTLSQLVTLGIAAAFPYLFNRSGISPNLISLSRSLLDYIPAVFLAIALASDMARQRHVDAFGLLVTLCGGLAGLLMHFSRLRMVRRFGWLVIGYAVAQLVMICLAPSGLSCLHMLYCAATLLLVLHCLAGLRPKLSGPAVWLVPILVVLSIVQPLVAMLTVVVLALPHAETRFRPLFTYLVPIAALLLLKFVATRLPVATTVMGIPANWLIATALSLLLCVVVVVLLYRDAPHAGLPRFWLCASAVWSAPLSAMACIMCLQDKGLPKDDSKSKVVS